MISDKTVGYEELIETIEYHLLAEDITERDTVKGCKQAISHHVPVVCVKPCYVHQAVDALRGSNTIAATVIGYPFGDRPTIVKAAETKLALTEGVLELNLVANSTYLIDGKDELFQKDLESICCLARMNGALTNVILNCQILSDDLIEKATQYAVKIGAAWLSPSTGLEEINEEDYLPLIKKAAQGQIKLKSMGSLEPFGDWLKKSEMGFHRIGSSDLITLIKSIEENQ